MKTFSISRENFRDAIEKLWEDFAENPTASFSLCPFRSDIGVYQDGVEVAIINVVDIVDEYELVSELMGE